MALTALDFPASPTNGQLYPDPPVTGQPQYAWNGSQWLSSKAAVTQIARADALGWSGMQINGSMEVSQERGTTATSTAGQHIVDGWQLQYVGTGIIAGAQYLVPSFVPGFNNWLIVTVPTAQATINAADYFMIWQKIEGYRVARLGWGTANAQPLTIGFWTNHTRTGTYSVTARNSALNRGYATTYTQTAASVPQYQIITIPGDTSGTWLTDNGIGLYLTFALAMGSSSIASAANTWIATPCAAAPGQVNGVAATSDIFRLTGVIVLPGIDAPTAAQSSLIMRPYGEELLTCQRYWYATNPLNPKGAAVGSVALTAVTANVLAGTVKWGVTLRAAPAVTLWGNGVAGGIRRTSDGAVGVLTGNTMFVSQNYFTLLSSTSGGLTPIGTTYDTDFIADARL